jgi:hypothetical protein
MSIDYYWQRRNSGKRSPPVLVRMDVNLSLGPALRVAGAEVACQRVREVDFQDPNGNTPDL